MAAIVNGLSPPPRAFGATFFTFSDYAWPAIRLSALMELPTILVHARRHGRRRDGRRTSRSSSWFLRAIPA